MLFEKKDKSCKTCKQNNDLQILEKKAFEKKLKFEKYELKKCYKKRMYAKDKIIKENEDKTNAKLSFNYNIQDPADHDYEYLQKDVDFNNYLGALLQHIIMDSLENKEAKIGNKTSVTDTYTEQSSR